MARTLGVQGRRPPRRYLERMRPGGRAARPESAVGVLVAIGAVATAFVLPATAAPGVDKCRGVPVTITENEKGDPISNGDDLVIGSRGRDVVNLAGGDDKFDGAEGDDLACAGSGEDLMLGYTGDDTLYGGAGDDFSKGISKSGLSNPPRVVGGPGDDELYGGGGKDAVNGSDDDDKLFGNGGDDLFDAGAGFDECDGGSGDDRENGSCDSSTSIP